MRIYPVSQNSIAFKRQLTKAETSEFQKVTAEAKQVLGNTGNSVLILSDACLPQDAKKNIGVANLLDKNSQEFFDFAKTYWGINTVQVLPQGECLRVGRSGLVCSYAYSALGLNDGLISAEALTQPKWKGLLKPSEFEEIVVANDKFDKDSMVNFDNVNSENSVFQKTLRKAFNRFVVMDENEPLKREFEVFKSENNDWLKPKSVYRLLKKQNGGKDFYKWDSDLDRELYDSTSRFTESQRKTRIDEVLNSNKSDVDFFEFKQFLAEKHLEEARHKLNKKGLKLFGDMLINFSEDEKWANPQAFRKDYYIGSNDWRASCLDYHNIRDENSASAKLLKRKAGLFAKRYDGTRFDAAWMYINPKMINRDTKQILRLDLGSSVLDLIENEFKKVKGATFSKEDLSYEFKAGFDEFSMFKDGAVRPEVASRVAILESEFMSDTWGHNNHFRNVAGFKPEGYILGVGDHTAQPLAQIALGVNDGVEVFKSQSSVPCIRRDAHAPALAKLFNDTVENMSVPANFVRAKFADIIDAKHNFVFYMDALGRTSRFDSQGLNNSDNYRFKIGQDYQQAYHKNVQKGFGLNLPDVMAKAFERAGLQEQHADLYKKLQDFAKILKEKDVEDVVDVSRRVSSGKWGYVPCILACVGGALLLGSALFTKPESKA